MLVRKWEQITKAPRPTNRQSLIASVLPVLENRRANQGVMPAGVTSPVLELVHLAELRLNAVPGQSPTAALTDILEEALDSTRMVGTVEKWPSGRTVTR